LQVLTQTANLFNLLRFFDCKKIEAGLRKAVHTKGEPYSPTESFDPRAWGPFRGKGTSIHPVEI
jgi:hypothetical protein